MSPPLYRADGTLTGYADRIATVFAEAVLAGDRARATQLAQAAPDLDGLFLDIVRDRDLAIYMAQTPLSKSLGHAGGLPVIAIGPHGGKIVGYQGGDISKPIYAGTNAAQVLAEQAGEEDAGTHGLAEMLSALADHFGIKATPASKVGGTYQSTVQGSATALAAAKSTYDGPGVSWVPVSATEYKLVLDPDAGIAPVEYAASTVKQKGGPPPTGWPEGHPGPGAVFVKTVDGSTYTLEIIVDGGKPGYVVTSPGPLFLFAGGAYGAVQGQVGDGPPVAVKFASASAAAIACLGPKEKDGKWIKKSTNGHWWWGWKGKTSKKAPDIAPEEHTGAIAAVQQVDLSLVVDSSTALAGEAGILWVDGLPPPAPAPPEPEFEPEDWQWPHPPGTVASKTVPNVKNGPKNAGLPAVLILLPSGEMQAVWPEGGAIYDKKGAEVSEVAPGHSEIFASPTAAAQAFTGTPTNGHKWWFKLGDVEEPGEDNFETMPDPAEDSPGDGEPEAPTGDQAVGAWLKTVPDFGADTGELATAVGAWIDEAPLGTVINFAPKFPATVKKTESGWKNVKTGTVYGPGSELPIGLLKTIAAGTFGADFIPDEPEPEPEPETMPEPEPEILHTLPPAADPEWLSQIPDPLDMTKSAVTKWLNSAPDGTVWDSDPGAEYGALYTKIALGTWAKALKSGSIATPYPTSVVATAFMASDAVGKNPITGFQGPAPTTAIDADEWISSAPGSFTAEWLASAPVGSHIDASKQGKGVYRKTVDGWIVGKDTLIDAGQVAGVLSGMMAAAVSVPADLLEASADWADQQPDPTGVVNELPAEWEEWLADAPVGVIMGPVEKTENGWEWLTLDEENDPSTAFPVLASGFFTATVEVYESGQTSLSGDPLAAPQTPQTVAQPDSTDISSTGAGPTPTGWPAWAPPPGTEYEHNGWVIEVIDHLGHPGFMVEGDEHALHLDDLSHVAQHIEAADGSPPGSVLPSLAAGLGLTWPPAGFASFAATKVLKVAKKAPENTGKTFKIKESPAGYTVIWLEGGKDYASGQDVQPGYSADFGSHTAAAKAVANAAVNAQVWWGIKPGPKGTIVDGVTLQPITQPQPAADPGEVFEHLFDDPESNWDEWESDTESSPGEWLEYAPDGAVVHAGQDNYWKVDGIWHDSRGKPVPYGEIAAALDVGASRSIQGLGPDGKVYPKGTRFKWVTLEHTLASKLGPALSVAVPGATYFINPKDETVTTVKVPADGLTGDEAADKIKPVLDAFGLDYDPDSIVKHVGGTFIYLAIPAVDDDVVVDTETIVVPTLPTSATHSNNELLDAAPLPEHSLLGLAIDADSDKISDQHVKQRLMANGRREITFKLTQWARKKASASLSTAYDGVVHYGHGAWNGSTAPNITKPHFKSEAKMVSGAGWTASVVGSKYWTFSGTVRMTIDPGKDPREALDEFGAKAGIGPLAHAPSPEDVERFKALKILYSVDPQAHDALLASGSMPDLFVVEKALAKRGVSAADAIYVAPTPSHRTLSLRDGAKIRASGLAGVRHNWSSTAEAMAEALSQGGIMSTEVRMRTGIAGTGISSSQDVNTGGAASIFTHPILAGETPSNAGLGGKTYSLFYGTRVLERADWSAYTADAYGSTKPSDDDYKGRPGRYASGTGHVHEITFRHGLGTDELAGIICSTQAARSKLITALKAKGLSVLGGVPVEDAVVVQGSAALKRIEDDWLLTLEGRTP